MEIYDAHGKLDGGEWRKGKSEKNDRQE